MKTEDYEKLRQQLAPIREAIISEYIECRKEKTLDTCLEETLTIIDRFTGMLFGSVIVKVLQVEVDARKGAQLSKEDLQKLYSMSRASELAES